MSTGQLIIGLVFIVIGISSFTNFDLFHYLWPAILIFIGIRILMGKSRHRRGEISTSELSQDDINEVAIFSGSAKRVTSSAFTGGKAASIFSGKDLDLTHAKIKGKSAELELVAVFGGLKAIVPKDWRVVTEGAGVIGGFTNHTTGGSENSPKVIVRGAAIFGGVEIVN
jgi:predicted membrane protein